MISKNKKITGSGGKGGGGGFYEADDTLQSTATVKVLDVLSQGQIVGVVDDKKGVFINGVPLMNQDGTTNFNDRAMFRQRVGTRSQEPMENFAAIAVPFTVGTQILRVSDPGGIIGAGGAVVYSVSDASVTQLRVQIGLNNGLATNEGSKLTGAEVELAIDRKLTAGSWEQVAIVPIKGKTRSRYEHEVLIERPPVAGTFDIRVRRITPDNASATLYNQTFLNRVVELTASEETYEDVAYTFLAIDAESVANSSVPTRSWLVLGIICAVPTNDHSGVWDGTFKSAWTDNPAWIIWDLLVNKRYGLGIDPDNIDKYAFYDAAVYNNELVDDGEGGTRKRFTFHYQFLKRVKASEMLDVIAGAMNAKILYGTQQVSIIQDRPTDSTMIVNSSMVENGLFNFRWAPNDQRFTAAVVTWNDPENRYNQSTIVVDKYTECETTVGDTAWSAMLDAAQGPPEAPLFGYNTTEFHAVGCTNEAQARAAGRWALYTSLEQTLSVNFTMGINGFALPVGSVFDLYDESFTAAPQDGRLIAGSTTTSINLDKAVTLTSGSKIQFVIDGVIVEKNIVQTSGSLSTITITSALPTAPPQWTPYIITTSTVSPMQFKVIGTKINQDDDKITVDVEAVQYIEGKYDFVENDIVINLPPYTTLPALEITAPTNLDVAEWLETTTGELRRVIHVSWSKPAVGIPIRYEFKARVANGPWSIQETTGQSLDFYDVAEGTWDIEVRAINYNNVLGPPATTTYTVNKSGGNTSPLDPVTDLENFHGGGTTFAGTDLTIVFTNPASNATDLTQLVPLKDFQARVLDPDDDSELAVYFLPPVDPGATQTATYTYAMNTADFGGVASREIKVEICARDVNLDLSTPTTVTFTNDAPAVPANITDIAIPNGLVLQYDPVNEPDLVGYGLYWSYSSPVTFDADHLILLGNTTSTTFQNFTPSTDVYYHVFAYDTFNTEADITGATNVNLSAEFVVETDTYDAPPLLSLQATGIAFVFDNVDDTTSDSPTITFTAVLANTTGTATFTAEAFDDAGVSLGTLTLGGSGNTRTMTAAQFNSLGALTTQTVRVTATLGSLSDSTTVYRGDGGASNIQAALSNEAHTLPADASGTVSTYANSGTTIEVYEGLTPLTYDGVGTAAGTWAVSPSASNITCGSLTDSGTYVTVGNHSAMTADTASITYTITGKNTYGVAFTHEKVQTFAKSKAGNDAVTYSISSNVGAISESVSGTFTPTAIVFSGYSATGSAAPTAYSGRFIIATTTDGTNFTNQYTSASNESSKSYTVPAGVVGVRGRLYQAGGTTTLFDEQYVPVVSDGAIGSDGEKAITIVVRNMAHVLPSDSSGNVSSYTNSGTIINVYEGSTALVYNTSLGVGAAGKFTIGTPTVAPTSSITVGSISGAGTADATVANHSGASAAQDTIRITYPITIWRVGKAVGDYDPNTYNVSQTLTKGKQGSTGATGSTGQRGSQDFYVGGRTSWSDSVATAAVGGSPIVNDHVTQYDSSGGTFAQTRYWNGSAWTLPGTVIDGSVLVNGSITAGKINVVNLAALNANMGNITSGNYDGSGYLRAQGNVSLTVSYFGGSATRTAAIVGNTSLGAQVGMYGRSSGTGNFAVMGVDSTGFSGGSYGIGVYGEGGIGGQFYALNTSSIGVQGVMNGSAGAQTAGLFSNNGNSNSGSIGVSVDMNGQTQRAISTQQGTIEFNGDGSTNQIRFKTAPRGGASNYAVLHNISTSSYSIGVTSNGNATGSASITPISISLSTGITTFGSQIASSVSTGTAPFSVSSTTAVTNLNADLLDGQHASAFQTALGYTPVRQGTGTSQLGNTLHMGWGGSQIRLQVDSTDFGTTWPMNVSGSSASLSATVTAGSAATTGAATANFPGNNKPGGTSTVTWIPWTHNGVSGYIPFWT